MKKQELLEKHVKINELYNQTIRKTNEIVLAMFLEEASPVIYYYIDKVILPNLELNLPMIKSESIKTGLFSDNAFRSYSESYIFCFDKKQKSIGIKDAQENKCFKTFEHKKEYEFNKNLFCDAIVQCCANVGVVAKFENDIFNMDEYTYECSFECYFSGEAMTNTEMLMNHINICSWKAEVEKSSEEIYRNVFSAKISSVIYDVMDKEIFPVFEEMITIKKNMMYYESNCLYTDNGNIFVYCKIDNSILVYDKSYNYLCEYKAIEFGEYELTEKVWNRILKECFADIGIHLDIHSNSDDETYCSICKYYYAV